ncbi:MAG: helix-turn-helix domain-containing protein [Polyangiales bacterium]
MAKTTAAATFADEIKLARESLQLTQDQWAKRLGVSTRTISRWEAGEAEPNTAAQKATVAQAIHAAGLSGTVPGLANLAVGMVGAPGVVGALVGAAAMAAHSRSANRGLRSARNKLRILDTVVTSAESLGLVPERLADAQLALLDAALIAGVSLPELRELLDEQMREIT